MIEKTTTSPSKPNAPCPATRSRNEHFPFTSLRPISSLVCLCNSSKYQARASLTLRMEAVQLNTRGQATGGAAHCSPTAKLLLASTDCRPQKPSVVNRQGWRSWPLCVSFERQSLELQWSLYRPSWPPRLVTGIIPEHVWQTQIGLGKLHCPWGRGIRSMSRGRRRGGGLPLPKLRHDSREVCDGCMPHKRAATR